MSLPTKTRQWTLKSHPDGLPTYGSANDTFVLEERELASSLSEGEILVQSLYLSNDPAQRGWISAPGQVNPKKLYVPPVPLGQPMRARGLAKVLSSRNSNFKEGDVVLASVNWVEYVVINAADPKQGVRKVDELPGLSLTHYLGALGMTGLTAYYGFAEVVAAKKGERVVVSGAAGATGSMVVQIAKHIVGAGYVVGIAGSDEKCRWVESLGADKCLNYKDKDFKKQLDEACGGGVDVYFDNVGGEILDAMLANMNFRGRISACGAITGYNGETATPMKNWFYIISQRLEVKGFIVIDYLHKASETISMLAQAVKDGKIKIGDENETVVKTKFEDIPGTWLKLFDGANQGKLVTALQ